MRANIQNILTHQETGHQKKKRKKPIKMKYRECSTDEYQMVKNHLKKYLKCLGIREMQIK